MHGMTLTVAVVCGCGLFGALLSRRLQGTIVTLPMVYVVLGLAISPVGIGLVNFEQGGDVIRVIAELTLILVLSSDASRTRMRSLRKYHNIPVRLLGIGLPLMIVVGAIAAVAIFDGLLLWEAVILAVVLAPTDAGLGQAVVVNPKIPIRIRQALNIESGLNDGLAMPVLLIAIGVLSSTEQSYGVPYWVGSALLTIFVGAVVGVAVGFAGGRLIVWSSSRWWMTRGAQKLSSLLLAVLAYSLAETLGGNGFIAAFCMGAAAANAVPARMTEEQREFREIEVELMMMLTFMVVFGAIMLPAVVGGITGVMVLYALISLAIIRPLTVAFSLIGVNLRPVTMAFIGWFGPRGIASILYVFIVLESDLGGINIIYGTAMLTVLISVFAHGITAAPGAKWYSSRLASQIDAESNELQAAPELPLRHPVYRLE